MTEYEKNRLLQTSLIDRQVYCGLGNTKEIGAASYQRVPITFTTPTKGQVSNGEEIEFPIATEDWGEVTKIAIYDAPTGGNKVWEATPEVVKSIGEAAQYKIPKGYLLVRLR